MTIIVCDKLQKDRGGAEKVLKELCRILAPVIIYTTTVDNIDQWKHELGVSKIITPIWGRFFRNRQLWFIFYPLICLLYSIEKISTKDFVFVYSSSAGKFINIKSKKRLLYTNYPARGIFYPETFFKSNAIKKLMTTLVKIFIKLEKKQYDKFQHIYCISKSTQLALYEKCKVESKVINCPISAHWFDNFECQVTEDVNFKSKYILISRLTKWKNLDFIFQYFENQSLNKLTIIGTGELFNKYKNLYTKNCSFLGFVEENNLRKIISQHRALIFPTKQEWGLPLIEANACGLPVIALDSDAVVETQIIAGNDDHNRGCTAIVYKNNQITDLDDAIFKFDKYIWNKGEIISNASRFSPDVFAKKILNIVDLNDYK